MSKLSFNSDLHVHTNLSPCGHPDSTPAGYFEYASEIPLDTIGFSNHFWDSDIPGADDWYKPLGVDHLMKIREQIEDTKGVRVLIGCETEFPGRLALTKEHASNFDYVLITTSHFHHDVVISDIPFNELADVRNLLVERFLLGVSAGADLPVPVSMAHAFRPLGDYGSKQDELIESIPDRMFKEMFSYAADKRVSLEIHLPTLKHYTDNKPGLMSSQAARMIGLAKESGCTFTFGSDEHYYGTFVTKNRELHSLAEKLGITPDMMMEM